MMPTVRLNIVFTQNRFMAGDLLRAKILLDSSDPDTVIESLTAHIKGMGRTGWVNIHTDKIFESEKNYLDKLFVVCTQTSLSTGRHHFYIQTEIPETAPSSYESQYGVTRYEVKLRLLSNTEQASCSQVFPFFVVSRSFLSELPSNLLTPIDYADEIDFMCCTLPFGTVAVKVHLDRTGFVLGEAIEPRITISNDSRKKLKELKLSLLLKTQFEARSRYEHVDEKKLSEQTIDSALLGVLRPRAISQDLPGCRLRLPEDAPPTQNYKSKSGDVSIITIHYVLKLTALPGIEFEIPILVTAAQSRRNEGNTSDGMPSPSH